MPSGRTHAITTVLLAGGVGFMAHSMGQPTATITALAGGSLAGLLLTPDLDVNTGSISNKFARKTFGCFFGFVWAFYWQPYSRLIPHRSWLSHLPVISTAIRLAYLALPYLAWQWWNTRQVGFMLPSWFYMAFFGLCLADLVHWGSDQITKGKGAI